MSKLKINRRQIILDKALEMFNERGIEYVGLRELASMLDMRVSNITYYFPTKDDLVYELSMELSAANNAAITAHADVTMRLFLENFQQVFHNQVKYRCLLLSVVHLMRQNVHLAAEYKKTQTKRNATIAGNLRVLVSKGYLNFSDGRQLQLLVSGISLVGRFWISEATISHRKLSMENQMTDYLALMSSLLMPYATAKGKREMAAFS